MNRLAYANHYFSAPGPFFDLIFAIPTFFDVKKTSF